jgi:hypothetical protein
VNLIGGEILKWLEIRFAVGLQNGECMADLVRKYHPMIRELLEYLGPMRLPGSPSTRRLASGMGTAGALLNNLMGYSGVEVRNLGSTESTVKPGLAGLIDGVDIADQHTKSGTPSIMVSRIETPGGGAPSWVVSIPPTNEILGYSSFFDLIMDLQLMGAWEDNDMANAVLEAMDDAGVQKGEQIAIIGYSLGGIAAANVSRNKKFRERYSSPNLITLGSPIASIDIPEDTQVLALEHRQDVLAALAGRSNANTPNMTTVTRDLAQSSDPSEVKAAGDPWGASAHDKSFYRATLEMVDAMDDASVNAFRAAVAPAIPAGATMVTTQYEVKRKKVAPKHKET